MATGLPLDLEHVGAELHDEVREETAGEEANNPDYKSNHFSLPT
jgi:hypothetical protein